MTPKYLNELADMADPDKLWRLSGIDPLVAAARIQYHREGEIEIDDRTVVSRTDDRTGTGGYVLAWLWVDGPVQVDGDSCTMPIQPELPL